MDRSCSRRPLPPADVGALARQLDAVAEELGWGAPPLLLGLTADRAEEAAPPVPASPTTALDGVVGALVGFDAPPAWRALGVVVHGRGRALAPPSPERREDPRPVRVVHVVDRGGRSASVLRVAGQEPDGASEPGPGQGRLVDACRRAMGLATPPPPPDTTELWAAIWLDRLLADAAVGEGPADGDGAARRHPAIDLVAEHEPDLLPEALARLPRLGTLMGRARRWPELHRAAAAGEWAAGAVPAEAAAWMDAGMFARWTLGELPAVGELLGELDDLLVPGALAAVQEALGAWDLG